MGCQGTSQLTAINSPGQPSLALAEPLLCLIVAPHRRSQRHFCPGRFRNELQIVELNSSCYLSSRSDDLPLDEHPGAFREVPRTEIEETFRALVHRCANFVFSVGKRRTGSGFIAEEVAQEVFVRL